MATYSYRWNISKILRNDFSTNLINDNRKLKIINLNFVGDNQFNILKVSNGKNQLEVFYILSHLEKRILGKNVRVRVCRILRMNDETIIYTLLNQLVYKLFVKHKVLIINFDCLRFSHRIKETEKKKHIYKFIDNSVDCIEPINSELNN